MDINYESLSFSSQNNHATESDHFSQYFPPLPPEPPASQSSEIVSRTSRPTHSVLGATQSMFDSSSPQLVDYSIFDTPVDVSVGTLPPRPTTSRALAKGRVPRPRNAFMLFRSAFHRERRLLKSVEKDHRHISRIIGLCWAELPEAEKDVWRQKAELEKQQHALAYPHYRFKPTPRTKQPVKRNVNRNSDKEIERCRKIAKLIQTGKSGEELTHAVRRMDDEMPFTSPSGSMVSDEEKKRKRQATSDHTRSSDPSHPMGPQFAPMEQELSRYISIDEHPHPPFRSPLPQLPPLPQTSSKHLYPTSAPEMQQPATANNQLGSLDSSSTAPPYSNPEYLSRQLDQGIQYHQPSQSQPYQHSEWPSKYFPSVMTYGPESTHYSHYSVLSAMESTQAGFTPGNQFVPNCVDWRLYYKPSVLADNTASTSSTYDS